MDYRSIPINILSERINYDAVSGKISWKENGLRNQTWNSRYANKEIECIGTHGYICFNFTYLGKKYHLLAHRVCYAIFNKSWPIDDIDHIDGDKTNNRPENLRNVTKRQNNYNIRVRKNNKIGIKGVVFLGKKKSGEDRYAAFIGVNGKSKYIGTFPTADDAHEAYKKEAQINFGKYAKY